MARSSSRSSKKSISIPLNPKTTTYEWGGPIGSFFVLIFLPTVVLSLNTLCGSHNCATTDATRLIDLLKLNIIEALPNILFAIGIELVWLLLHSIFYLLPIGQRVEGLPLRTGKKLIYHLNAVHAFVLSHVVLFGLHYGKIIDLTILADLFIPLMIGAMLISLVMSVVLYVASFRKGALLALGGNSGNAFYDFWVGRELNPRTGLLDWKFMCELRPGLIGWSILNWAFVLKSVQLQTWTASIVLIALCESLYVFDGLLLEAGNLSMMDIVTDGFGFMLCFGDLTWVPFTYTIKTRYLAYHSASLDPAYVAGCTLLGVMGYVIFRGANSQKDKFRKNPRDPAVAHLKTMKTSAGKSLIISGYWGICRHPNYVGDWIMTLAWSLLTGTTALLPYFQPIYFAILLIHRQLRDERDMLHKYGEEDWSKFCKIVRYRLIPYIY